MTETMTQQEARVEARHRWGKRALISDRHWRSPEQRFLVSDCDMICGVGSSWEEAFERAAFADAERKEKRG